jgi:hypothetical protein
VNSEVNNVTNKEIIRIRMLEMGYSFTELSNATGIKLRTLKRYVSDPDQMRLGDFRAIHNRLRFSDEQLVKMSRSK